MPGTERTCAGVVGTFPSPAGGPRRGISAVYSREESQQAEVPAKERPLPFETGGGMGRFKKVFGIFWPGTRGIGSPGEFFRCLSGTRLLPTTRLLHRNTKPSFCMPTYEYQCEKCKRGFEFFQSMKDAPLAVCPKEACQMKKWGRGKVRRQLGTGAGLIFKGSGFYITDYRSESYKAGAKGDSASSSGGGDAGSAKGPAGESSKPKESKPAPAPKPGKDA